jgi:hypothetical protein
VRRPAVHEDHAFKARCDGREGAAVTGQVRLAPADDAHVTFVDLALEAFARPLTHFGRIEPVYGNVPIPRYPS